MLHNLFCLYGAGVHSLAPGRPQPASATHLPNGVAVVALAGTLSRDGRHGGTSTDQIRAELKTLADDPSVKQIVLQVNSPGGASAGTAALHDAVAATAKQKPVVAFVEDLAASAAYFAIAGATKIVASRSALIGAIGTYAVIEDISGMAAKLGVKVHVIKAGEFKGAGVPGTTFTDSQQAEMQRVINDINAQFLAAVREGRKLTADKLKIVSDGRIWIAADAKRYGLIDEIGTFESVLASSVSSAGANQARRGTDVQADFYSRLEAQQKQRGETFVKTWRRVGVCNN